MFYGLFENHKDRINFIKNDWKNIIFIFKNKFTLSYYILKIYRLNNF